MSDYLTTRDVALKLRKVRPDGTPNIKAADAWIRRHYHGPIRRAGRCLLVDAKAVELSLEVVR